MPTAPPPPTPPRAEVERLAALLDHDHPPPHTVEIAARWTREAPYGPSAIVGDRALWIDGQTLRAVSLRDGATAIVPAPLAAAWQRLPPPQNIAQIVNNGAAPVVSLYEDGVTIVAALGHDGKTRWRLPLPGQGIELRSDGDALFAFERDPTVWRLDPRSGRILWAHTSTPAIVDVVALATNLTAVVRPDDILLLDGAGHELMTRPRNPHVLGVAAYASRLYSCLDDGTLQAVDVASGRALWWARVGTASEGCAVLAANEDSVLVNSAGRWQLLDTTRPAPPAAAVTVRGRYENVYEKHAKLRGTDIYVGTRHVRTDARGRFVATVRAHGPIEVRVDGVSGSQGHAIIWPDDRGPHRVELSNYVDDDSCH